MIGVESEVDVASTIAKKNVIHREESIKMICEILARGKILSTVNPTIRIGIASGLERGIYNRAIELEEKNNVIASWLIPSFILTYKMSRHLLCEKIAPVDSNNHLEHMLCDPNQWSKMAGIPIYELHPETFNQNIRRIAERKPIVVKVKYSNIKCGNCKKYMVREESLQTRTADESSTPYQICDGCNTMTRLSS